MAINDITLAGSMRSNLVNLQNVAALQSRTTQRLSTGKRVNNAIDDPSAYFAAQNATNRAADLAYSAIQTNSSYAANLYYRLAPNVFLALEAAQVRTDWARGVTTLRNHYDLALAYFF